MRLNRQRRSILILGSLVLAAPLAFAQGGGMGQGKGMPNYDPTTEMTLKGTIQEINEVECAMSGIGATGTHLTLKSGNETMEVHLGPTAFLDDRKFSLARGEQIEVVGSKLRMNGAGGRRPN